MQLLVTPTPRKIQSFKIDHADLGCHIDRRQAVLSFPIPENRRVGRYLYSLKRQFTFEETDRKIIERKPIKAIRSLGRPMDQFFPKIPFEAFGQMKIKQEYSGCLLYTSPSPRDCS